MKKSASSTPMIGMGRHEETTTHAERVLSVVTVGPSHSPRAYLDAQGRATVSPRPALASHEYRPLGDGRMAHYIDGELRATVPPEGLEEYARAWPDCAELAEALRLADR